MKLKLFLLSILFMFCINTVYTQVYKGALTFWRANSNGIDINLTVSVKSLLFEGMTDNGGYPHNRLDSLQNGHFFRLYSDPVWPPSPSNVFDQPLTYFNSTTTSNMMIDLGAIMNGDVGWNGEFGFAIYEIKLDADDHLNPVEHYLCYFNTLDSKYDKINWHGQDVYSKDWFFIFDGSLSRGQRLYISANNEPSLHINVVNGTEYKVWDIIYNQPNPWATDFYIRTTPVPFSPEEIFDHRLRNFYLGTNAILDDCLPNVYPYHITERQGYNTFVHSDNSFVNRNYYTNPPIVNGENDIGRTFCTPAMNYFDDNNNPVYGTKITARSGEKLTITHDKKFWVSGTYDYQNSKYQGDTLIFSPGSSLQLDQGSYLETCFGGCIFDSGAVLTHHLSRYWAHPDSWIGFYGNTEHVINNGAQIIVDGGATLIVGDNTTLTFDGAYTYLWLSENSSVKLGENAKINFKNGAWLHALNSNFASINSSQNWQELYLENQSYINIRNCTFSGATTALNINGQIPFQNGGDSVYFNIWNNTFNISASGGKGIYAENVQKMLCYNNTFNISSNGIGVMVQNHSNSGSSIPGGPQYSLNFLNNNFYNGYIQMYLGSYAAAYTPFYVYNNNFSNNSGGWCFAGRMITDVIKNNTFNTGSNYVAIGLWQSDIRLFQNTINNSSSTSIQLNNAFPLIAPLRDGNRNLIWYGGKNDVYSSAGDNININNGYAIIDWGQNTFTINNSSAYHIYGTVPDSVLTYYYGRNNCWYNNGIPRSFIWNGNNPNIPVLYSGNLNCPLPLDQITNTIIVDKGDSTYDTISISSDNSSIQPLTDEIIFTQANQYSNQNAYLDAIINYKNLINNYQLSNYLIQSLSQMFTCYEQLDTSTNQNYKYTLYNDCETYLNAKIQEYQNNLDFVNIAYNLVLNCEAHVGDLNGAASGYELIALYNPDPEIRLYASWDYGYIQELINGEGGGESNVKNQEKLSQLRIKKLLDKNHSARIVKSNYDKLLKKVTKSNEQKSSNGNLERTELLKNTAKSNIFNSKKLTRKDKEIKRQEQMELLFGKPGSLQNQIVPVIPKKFELMQNYPNPFNPVTKIKFELPNNKNVTLKIYDILGREISVLINNEFKRAGVYEVDWNGSNFASGVYFYRIEAGNFVSVKKMVLVK